MDHIRAFLHLDTSLSRSRLPLNHPLQKVQQRLLPPHRSQISRPRSRTLLRSHRCQIFWFDSPNVGRREAEIGRRGGNDERWQNVVDDKIDAPRAEGLVDSWLDSGTGLARCSLGALFDLFKMRIQSFDKSRLTREPQARKVAGLGARILTNHSFRRVRIRLLQLSAKSVSFATQLKL